MDNKEEDIDYITEKDEEAILEFMIHLEKVKQYIKLKELLEKRNEDDNTKNK